jgi:hypothetical protein
MLANCPVVLVVVGEFVEEFGEGLALSCGGPEAGFGHLADVDFRAHSSGHRFLPPAHHEVHVALDEGVQPIKIAHSVAVFEVGPEESLEGVGRIALESRCDIFEAHQLCKWVEGHGPFQDGGEDVRILESSLDDDVENGVEEVMDHEWDAGVGFKEEFPVDIVDKCVEQFAEDFEEFRASEKAFDPFGADEVDSEQMAQIVEDELRENLEGLVHVQRLEQSCDVMKILKEGVWGAILNFHADQAMDVIDIADFLSVEPDDGDNVEEGSAFVVVFRVSEDCALQILEKGLDYLVETLESGVVVFLETHVDHFEEVQGVVQHLGRRGSLEVGQAEVDYPLQEGNEVDPAAFVHVPPEG